MCEDCNINPVAGQRRYCDECRVTRGRKAARECAARKRQDPEYLRITNEKQAENRKLHPEKHRRANQKWAQNNPDKKRAVNNRRRAQQMKAKVTGRIDYEAIRKRDGASCYLCGKQITEGQPSAFDHIVPLSRQGEECEDNLALVHALCNGRKKDKLLSELPWFPPTN